VVYFKVSSQKNFSLRAEENHENLRRAGLRRSAVYLFESTWGFNCEKY